MKAVYLNGRTVKPRADQILGSGTEADVYRIGNGLALKLFKQPDHPDLQGDQTMRNAAAERLAEIQRKLPLFPTSLSDRVVAPTAFAQEKRNGAIVGYAMRLVEPAERLKSYRPDRLTATRLLINLTQTLEEIHRAQVVVGDFTPMNLLASGAEAYFIDADSFQFKGFVCRMFTENYVDPLICDPGLEYPCPIREQDRESDRFALAAIALEVLLGVTPYHGGVCKRKGVQHRARPLKRITVFDPDVVYPRQALHFSALPDELLQYFSDTFERDRRGILPVDQLQGMQWQTCQCGLQHARAACPKCGVTHGKVALPPMVVTRGNLRVEVIYETKARIQHAAVVDEKLNVILQEQDQTWHERDGVRTQLGSGLYEAVAFYQGKPIPLRNGAATLSDVLQEPIDSYQGRAQFAGTTRHAFWVSGGFVWEYDGRNRRIVCETLRGQTRIWAGDALGFGYFRAGGIAAGYLFQPGRPGTIQCRDLGLGNVELLAMQVLFSAELIAWVIVTVKAQNRLLTQLRAIGADGGILHTEECEELSAGMHGACAVPSGLFVPTDEGILRISAKDFTKTLFAATAEFIEMETRLLISPNGIYAVTNHIITELRIG